MQGERGVEVKRARLFIESRAILEENWGAIQKLIRTAVGG